MNASMPLLWTTSACSTVVYQSTIAWNCLVASTACANFAGTTRRVPFPLAAELDGIAILLRRRSTRCRGPVSIPPYCSDRHGEQGERALFRRTQKRHQPARAPLRERTGWCRTEESI